MTSSSRVPASLAVAGLAGVALAVTTVGLSSTEVVWSLAALGVLTAYYVARTAVSGATPS